MPFYFSHFVRGLASLETRKTAQELFIKKADLLLLRVSPLKPAATPTYISSIFFE